MKNKHTIFLLPLAAAVCTLPAHAGAAENSSYTIGAGAMAAPKYPGANSRKTQGFPILSGRQGRFFFGMTEAAAGVPFGLGIYLMQSPELTVGVGLAYDLYSVRKESDDAVRLRGLGDIEKTGHATVFARHQRGSMSAYAALTGSGASQGVQARFGVDFTLRLGEQLIANAGPSLTWSSSRSNRTFYGVTARQSASSGLRQYAPSSGVSEVRLSAGLSYLLSPAWSIGVVASAGYLPANVGDSPIVEKNVVPSYGAFTSYSF